jgi:hypothetical protein
LVKLSEIKVVFRRTDVTAVIPAGYLISLLAFQPARLNY